ncbi:MAG: hypothetical protein JRE40_14955 [Deltaproteobacteria bacterium]|nr:hypothetical protein [Deltaproteobacteria bacterium]
MERVNSEEGKRVSEKVMKKATQLRRKQKMEEYKLAEIERGIKRAEAKAKLAGAKARKSEAEAEVWKARRAKLGAILSPPSGSGARKAGKKARGVGKALEKGYKGLEKWARSGDTPPSKKRVTKRKR